MTFISSLSYFSPKSISIASSPFLISTSQPSFPFHSPYLISDLNLSFSWLQFQIPALETLGFLRLLISPDLVFLLWFFFCQTWKEVAKPDNKDCVKVAVNIRPLITAELLIGCTDCITLIPGEPQLQIGSHAFTFDHVYGSISSSSSSAGIFGDCVAPLVDALFHGYNAIVLAYGQTGSGKTYTMRTNYSGEANNGGIIPKVMETIFSRIAETKDNVDTNW